MISKDIIEQNKNTFISILTSALESRPGSDIQGLLNKLHSSDFFVAPASTKYHASYEGGLVDHSLNVYYNMMSLAKNKHLIKKYDLLKNEDGSVSGRTIIEGCIDESSIAIVALLHDFSKMNFYKKDYRNKKVYCESGSKHDNGGNFDWVTEETYSIIPVEERFLYGNHEETSEFMIRKFIPLTYEESTAILHHHYSLSYDSIKDPGIISQIYDRYPIACLLHVADVISCNIDEKVV